MAVRLQDVAERAGVSVRTVSNVVNGFPHVVATTRASVQAVLDELGYRPNASARQSRLGRSETISLAVPEIDSPYFSEVAALLVSQERIGGGRCRFPTRPMPTPIASDRWWAGRGAAGRRRDCEPVGTDAGRVGGRRTPPVGAAR